MSLCERERERKEERKRESKGTVIEFEKNTGH